MLSCYSVVHPPPNELPLDWLYLSSFRFSTCLDKFLCRKAKWQLKGGKQKKKKKRNWKLI